MWLWTAIAGCDDPNRGGERPDPSTSTPTTSTPTASTPTEDRFGSALALEGRVEFLYDYDEAAVGDQLVDCAHAREFVGREIPGAAATLCTTAACEHVFFGWTVVPEENRACFHQLSPTGAYRQPELWLVGEAGWNRLTGPYPGQPLFPSEAPVEEGVPASVAYALDLSPTLSADVSASMTYAEDPALRVAGRDAEAAPYACGWPEGGSRARGPIVSYGPLPDHVLEDQCGEPVHTGDFAGAWTLHLTAGPDCDTCRVQAAALPALKAAHPELAVVTYFYGTDAEYDAWRADHPPVGPLLHDDGWGRLVTWLHAYAPVEGIWMLVGPDEVAVDASALFTDWSVLDASLR